MRPIARPRNLASLALGRVGLAAFCLVLAACSSTPAAPTKSAADTKPSTESKPAAESKAAPQTSAAPANAVLRLAVSTFNEESFDPTLTSPGAGSGYAGPLWDWMTTYTEGEGLKPGLALTWAQDGLNWTFTMRQGVKFHDGTEMTAEDVRFSLMEGFRRPEARSSRSGTFKTGIKEVTVVDKYTVKVETANPWPTLAMDLSNQPGAEGIVLPKAYIEKVGWPGFADAPVATGPWKFVRRQTGNFVEYDAHKEYWGGAPDFAQLRMLLVPEDATRQAMLRAREADVVEVALDKIASTEQAGFKILENPESTSYVIMLFGTYNDAAGPLKDVRVRQALNHAVDRQGIIQSLFGGRGQPATVYPVGPGRIGYPDDLSPYAYDLAKARQLLSEAGAGSGFTLKIFSSQGEFSNRLAETIAGTWNSVGVRTTVEPIDIGVLRPKYAANPQSPDIIGNSWILGTASRLNGASDFPAWWTQSGNLVKMANDLDPQANEATAAPTLEELDRKTKDFYRATYQSSRAIPIAYAKDAFWAYGNQVASIQFPRASYRAIQPSIHTAKRAG